MSRLKAEYIRLWYESERFSKKLFEVIASITHRNSIGLY